VGHDGDGMLLLRLEQLDLDVNEKIQGKACNLEVQIIN
jgi:hypothetical protein